MDHNSVVYVGVEVAKAKSQAHARWLAGQAFDHPAQQIVFQDQIDAVADAQTRLARMDQQ
jgi:hypothetical protein